jgi:KipI family sensor histidine kinase inhibitor
VTPLGDTALVMRVAAVMGGPLDATTAALCARAIARAVAAAGLPGVVDVVPSPDRVTVVCDPTAGGTPERLLDDLAALARAASAETDHVPGVCHEVVVCYGGAAGPDLDAVCRVHGIDRETLVRLHTQPEYLVTAIGFVPGFPYLAGLPAALATPRRDTPRTRVPAGSVGIGGGQTGIYPFATPGGWHLIGRTAVRLFDPRRVPPALLQVGDRVRFVTAPPGDGEASDVVEASDVGAAAPAAGSAPPSPLARRITILRPGLLSTVQDLGRPGHRAAGVPLGGAVDAVALRVANLAVGNPAGAAALECTLTGPVVRFECDATVALAGAAFTGLPRGRPVHVAAGTVLDLGHAVHGCRGCLAVAGGIDVEPVLGSRSTYLPATLGGHAGRALVAGDVLPLGPAATRTTGTDWSLAPSLTPLPAATTPLRLVPAADVPDAWEAGYRVTARSDRMGARLVGPPLAVPGDGMSVAVLPGTVQVPPDGQPIILLADAQTIGGYPVLGQVIVADLPLAGQLRPSDTVRFVPVDRAAAGTALRRREAHLAAAGLALAARTVRVTTVDVNADVGEGAGHDAAILPLVSAVNIACGAHAGDAATMRETVALARRHGVAIGAHPGHADPAHRGRRALPVGPDEVADLVAGQIAALEAIAGGPLAHVKLHGALYHQVADDAALAAAVAARLARSWPRLVVVAPVASTLASVARAHGLVVAEEAFIDRAYADDGRLLARSQPGAVLADPAAAATQAVRLARAGRVRTVGGRELAVRADTLCVHGDGPDPVGCLRAVRAALAAAGIDVGRG